MFGGSVCESNTPKTSRRCLAPVLKTGRVTGPHALPRSVLIIYNIGKVRGQWGTTLTRWLENLRPAE